MTLKYESEILFDLMKRDGDVTPSDVLPYESELKEKYLNQVVGAYPKLQDYRAEWLNYNLYNQLPSEFPVESVANVTSASFNNVVPYAYIRVILKGNTKVIPVGKNIFDKTSKLYDGWLYQNGNYCEEIGGKFYTTDFIEVKPNTNIVVNNGSGYAQYDDNKKCVCNVTYDSTTTLSNAKYIRVVVIKEAIDTLQIEYGTVSTDYEEPTYELQSVKMPVLTTSNEDGTKTNILTVNEPIELRGIGNVYDELDLLTGKLTQRIDEDGSVLTQEVVKTVDLSCVNEQGESVTFRPIEGTMHVSTSSQTLLPLLDMSVPVEATSQNLMSFANILEEE